MKSIPLCVAGSGLLNFVKDRDRRVSHKLVKKDSIQEVRGPFWRDITVTFEEEQLRRIYTCNRAYLPTE